MFKEIQAVIRRIPKGKVATYGGVAEAAGFPGASRQVSWALRNAAIGLPWQRVVGAGGRILLTGSNAMEQRLRLEMEGVAFSGDRVRMDRHEFVFVKPRRKAPRKAGKGVKGLS